MGIRRGRSIRAHPANCRGTTLVESLIVVALLSLLIVVVWFLLGNFTGRGRLSIATGTSKTLVQQQGRIAFRKLYERLREAVQVLEPAPGHTGTELVFRDMFNRTVKLRIDPVRKQLISERLVSGNYVSEEVLEQEGLMARPIRVSACDAAHFSAMGPMSVFVSLTSTDAQVGNSFMGIIFLANSRLAL